MKKKVRYWRWRILVPLLHASAGLLAMLSRRQIIALGRALGALVGLFSRRERQRANEHLAMAFPKLDEEGRKLHVRQVFDNLATGMLESLAMHQWRREYLASLIINPGEYDRIRNYGRDGRGVLFVTGHLGNWEMLGAGYVRHGGRIHVVGRRMHEPMFDSFLTDLRGASGVVVLDRDNSPREMLSSLRGGIDIGILPDQDITELEGIFVDFFGRPAYTPIAPAKLALAARTPICVAALMREGERFRLIIGDPITPRSDCPREGRQAEMERLTRAWSQELENIIRLYPGQWVWMHRRWRNNPERIQRRRQTAKLRRQDKNGTQGISPEPTA